MHSLPSNTALLTAIANDISYDQVFAFQLKKYAKNEDILLAISSSGNSPNIIAAIEMAKSLGLQTISFVGFNGGEAKKLSDYCIHVKVNNYGVVEDIHQSLMHILTQYLRLKYLDNLDDVGKKVF
jgi:phosphoheptose isomerase